MENKNDISSVTGWCAGGADHYEPVVAHRSSVISQEKVAMVL